MSHKAQIMKVRNIFQMPAESCRIRIAPFLLYIMVEIACHAKILWLINIVSLTNNATYCIYIFMAAQVDPYRHFSHPQSPGQKQYEALRAFYVDDLPARVVANRFGYTDDLSMP